MPITRGAKKKLRQDKKRQRQNIFAKEAVKIAIKTYRRKPSSALLSKVYKVLDKTAKKKIFHANKVARLKSRLTKLLTKKTTVTASDKPSKKASSRKKKSVV